MSRIEVGYRQAAIRLTDGQNLILRHFKDGKVELIVHDDHDLGTVTTLSKEDADDLRWIFALEPSD